jgi:hypothetical protein
MTMNRLLSILLFILIVAGGVRRDMLAALRPSWRSTRAAGGPYGLSQLPLRFARDPMPQDLIAFFERVERVTPAGSAVAVMLPAPWNDFDVTYARFRMSYLLAGHPIVIISSTNAGALGAAPYVAAWHPVTSPPQGSVVFSGHDGVLIRRTIP